LISWKYAFDSINAELEISTKKKQALDNLFNKGRISQTTYDYINQELTDIIAEIEARQKALADKMISKISELEQQTKTLEMFLANLEIRYAAGEIDEEPYTKESSVLSLGLEATKTELGEIKKAVTQLIPEEVRPTPPTPLEVAEVLPAEAPEIPVQAPVEAPVEASTEEVPVEAPIEKAVEEPAKAPTEEPVEVETVSEEIKVEMPTEIPTEEPTDVSIEVTSEEAIIEEGVESPSEIAVEEAPAEEKFPSSEEAVQEAAEETVAAVEPIAETTTETTMEEASTEEMVTEAVSEETPMQEEASLEGVEETPPADVEAPVEETSLFQGEEEETKKRKLKNRF